MLWIALPAIIIIGAVSIRSEAPSPMLGALGGLSFGFSALATRAIIDVDGIRDLVTHPLVWVTLSFAACGVVLFTRGVEHGQVGSVTAAMWAAEIVPASVIGFFMLGDSVRPGWQIPAMVGLLLTLAATLSLARPVVSQPTDTVTLPSETGAPQAQAEQSPTR